MTAVVTEDENRSYWPTLYTYSGDTNTWVFTKNSFKERNFYLKNELYTKTEVDNELSGKLGKYYGQGADVLYGVNTDGTQEMYSVTTHAAAFTIARRDASGNITVGTPYADSDATSKAYVDDQLDYKASADWVLTQIDAESTARSNADTNLRNLIDGKQDTLSIDTGEDYTGITINNGSIGVDHAIIATNDYLDASIGDTMNYIMQEDDKICINFASKYDSSKTYNTGDYVINSHILWKAKEDDITGS